MDRDVSPLEPVPSDAPSPERLAQLRAMPYSSYRRTPEWREREAAALERTDGRCERDPEHREDLEVQHRSYDRLGAERPEDLVVLCPACRARPPVGMLAPLRLAA